MAIRIEHAVSAVATLLIFGAPVGAQIGVVIHGRVEDAAARSPVPGARILSADSSSAVFADSLGQFAILIGSAEVRSVHVEQYGYRSQTFELGEDAPSRISVLLLEPAPIELEGISVVEEPAVARLLRNLRSRRNAYQGSVMAYDRARLDRVAAGGSAWDFVTRIAPRLFECSSAFSGLCMRDRGGTFRDPFAEVPIRVCVDAWESWGAISELSSLDMRSVALVEVFSQGRGSIRIYTAAYLAHSASTRRNVALPLGFGC